MTQSLEKALLPAGLGDGLPPLADFEADMVDRLMATFRSHGYERVKPPLIEFEESLLAGPGAALAEQTFRVMDPQSQRMMGVRPDITLQVARIAATRLRNAPRPLRLSYNGQVLRVRGTQLRPERQFAQAGFELIGDSGVPGDAEVLTLAAEALADLGVTGLSVDIALPTLVPALCQALGFTAEKTKGVRLALDRKDAAAVAQAAGAHAALFAGLLAAAGPADRALQRLDALALPPRLRPLVAEVRVLLERVWVAMPDLALTVDPGEFRGFEYQTGLSFTVFARGVRGELGRGGRYALEDGEAATGFTVYLDSALRALPAPDRLPALYVPFGTDLALLRQFRRDGWRTVAGLAAVADDGAEALRLGCTHVVAGGDVRDLR